MRQLRLFTALFGALAVTLPASAAEDPAAFFRDLAATRGWTLGRVVKPVPTGDAILFLRGGPRDAKLALYEQKVGGGEREIASAQSLLAGANEVLSEQEKSRRERQRISFSGLTDFLLSDDARTIVLPFSGRLYTVDRTSGAVRALPGEGWIDPRLSADGKQIAAVKGGELFVLPVVGKGKPRKLTSGATATVTNGLAEFVAQEEMDRSRGFWWSPDGKQIAFERADVSKVERRWIGDPLRPERAPVEQRYPRPGGANADVAVGIVSVVGGKVVWAHWDTKRFPYLTRVTWIAPGKVAIAVMSRDQKDAQLLSVDAKTGKSSVLLSEHDDAWIELDGSKELPFFLPDGRFLWASDRDGSKRVELRGADGSFLRALTPANFGDVRVTSVDAAGGSFTFTGGSDLRATLFYRGTLDGALPVAIDGEPGVHQVRVNAGWFVDAKETASGVRSVYARALAGGGNVTLTERTETAPKLPEITFEKAGDYDAALVYPRDFDPTKRYPIILSVYGGPHHKQVVLRPSLYREQQWMADQGFIVALADNHGTPGGSRDWLRAYQGDMIGAPLRDQIFALRFLAGKHPEMDMTRVAPIGWSFGGYFSVMAVLQRPDVFSCAVAGAPVVDWRDYDTFYTERYMGLLPQDKAAYDKGSALTYAAKLEKPLLIEHGVTDDNVYFQHSLKLQQALLAANRPHELTLLPGTHMLSDPNLKTGERLRAIEFLKRCLKP
ncbi:peptidase [Rhodospirillales bacterium TMPK1]|uniref:Peptidase n=2 Tax=Roseiterribacter gracilis TaxID=2812848 RepID=A0A8S8XEB9_9PROT|nr:peptidase [Rhodospirillales bacterium TMPK1]